MSVCLYVSRLSARISRNHTSQFHKIFCTLPLAVVWSFSDDNAIYYVLLVLWMTSCFHIIEWTSNSQTLLQSSLTLNMICRFYCLEPVHCSMSSRLPRPFLVCFAILFPPKFPSEQPLCITWSKIPTYPIIRNSCSWQAKYSSASILFCFCLTTLMFPPFFTLKRSLIM